MGAILDRFPLAKFEGIRVRTKYYLLKHTFKVCGGGSEREGFFLRVENDFYN
jgi:hypothetical protein